MRLLDESFICMGLTITTVFLICNYTSQPLVALVTPDYTCLGHFLSGILQYYLHWVIYKFHPEATADPECRSACSYGCTWHASVILLLCKLLGLPVDFCCNSKCLLLWHRACLFSGLPVFNYLGLSKKISQEWYVPVFVPSVMSSYSTQRYVFSVVVPSPNSIPPKKLDDHNPACPL